MRSAFTTCCFRHVLIPLKLLRVKRTAIKIISAADSTAFSKVMVTGSAFYTEISLLHVSIITPESLF